MMVCSVSMARVRTDSILRKRSASSDLAFDMRAIESLGVLVKVEIDVEMLFERAFW